MALLQWRKFNFFDVAKEVDNGALAEALQEAHVTCTTSGRGHVVLGDTRGRVHFLSRQYEVMSHRVFDTRVTQLVQLRYCPLLTAAGEDEPGVSAVKVYSLEQLDGGGAPRLLRQIKLPPAADGGALVTSLCVHESLLFMAIGFFDGRVVLWRGDMTRDRSGKHQVLHADTNPVSGLGFRTSGKTHHLFVATSSDVFCYNITFKDKENQIHLDHAGCEQSCAVMSEGLPEPQFTVGRPDAIYCYSPNERGACFVFEGTKQLLHWFKGFLVVLAVESSAAGLEDTFSPEKHLLTVYDVGNKYVGLEVALRDVTHVVSEWGTLFVVTGDNRLHRFTEKDTRAKLDILFKRNLYDTAIRLAQSQQYDADGLMDIFREYGDHLYSSGDFSGAVQQYIKTIGKLEPSYVIRKYLDTQRITDLTQYLQALHRAGQASQDHTTLLLNCYTKLRDTHQLDLFIKGEGSEVRFDVDTAVRVCRSSGYYEQALALADRHQQHDRVVSILLEDINDVQRALDYIGKLDRPQCEAAIIKHGASLLTQKPAETVQLLKNVCLQEGEATVPLDKYIDLFVAQPEAQAEFLQHILEHRPDALDPESLLALLELYLSELDQSEQSDRLVGLRERALGLLERPGISLPLALHLCHTYRFHPGTAKLYQMAGMHSQILQTQLEAADWDSVLETCRQYGHKRPALWLEALRSMTKELNPPVDAVKTVLQHVEGGKVAPSMEVLDILVQAPTLELGTIRDYMSRTLSAEQAEIERDRTLAHKYAEEAAKIQKQIKEEQDSAMIFQRANCAACNQPLELPSVHFYCPHSYHQHCFQSYSDREDQCPLCQPENTRLMQQIHSQAGEGETEAQFYEQVQTADDMFDVVADYFAKGVFSRPGGQDAETAASGTAETRPTYGISAYLRTAGTPAEAVGPAGEARLRVADRGGTNVMDVGSEARVRTSEQRSQPAAATAEGRLRSAQTSQVTAAVPEGRVRSAEVRQPGQTVSAAEGRLRSAQVSQVTAAVPEGRVRSAEVRQPALAAGASEARHRLREAPHRSVAAPNPFEEGPNPFQEAEDQTKPTSAEPANPFQDDYDESKNPFGGDAGDDYDKALNPFE